MNCLNFDELYLVCSKIDIQQKMKNLGYLQCQRGGYHAGEYLNIVCLNPGCKNNLLCCCACVQQSHSSHKTKTLKKLLLDADTLSKNQNQKVQPKYVQMKQKTNLNTDIMANMVENQQKHIINELHELKKNFIKQIDQLQEGIHTYFKLLHKQLNKQVQIGNQDSYVSISELVQNVQGSSKVQILQTNVIKLIKSVQLLERTDKSNTEDEEPDQESYFNFLKNANIDIQNIVKVRVKQLYASLTKQNYKLKSINNKISSFWSNKLYKFSPSMHHECMQIVNPFTVRATLDSVYQMALMNPGLSFANQVETFTFRINTNDLEWVAIGVCYKKYAEQNNYQFQFNSNAHGCYMISGNAGTWSHSDIDYNNVVKAFNFKPGDSITCVVSKTKICFLKNVPAQFQQAIEYSQKEYYELEITPQSNETLHPCVVCFYQNTEVEYLPSFKNIRLELPNYKYKFCQKTKHSSLIILNENHLIGCPPTNYKCCILDKPIQDNAPSSELKSVTFRIVKSTGSWIGLGVCHKNIVVDKNYDFYFEQTGHGCYMISANGGSWSNTDQNENNIVKTFKFVQGDLVTVTLDQQNQNILFKKGIERYEMKYSPLANDKLYPIVVLYYQDDEVDVLPEC